MKKNGFTLIELVCVLIILGIVLLITLSYTSSTATKSKNTLSEIQKNQIIESAKEYYLKEGMKREYDSNYKNQVCVDLSVLIDKNYIDSNYVIDPKSSKELETGSILIKKVDNQYSYTYQDINCIE